MSAEHPRVVVIAEHVQQRMAFSDAVRVAGFELVDSLSPERLTQHNMPSADLWLIDSGDDLALIEHLAPTERYLLGFTAAPKVTETKAFEKWQRALVRKLWHILGKPKASSEKTTSEPKPLHRRPDLCAVLGASLGGPKAVKQFLDELPADLPLALILGQHNDPAAMNNLGRVLTRHNMWHAKSIEAGDRLSAGTVWMVPPNQQIELNHEGYFSLTPKPNQNYRPCISDVLLSAAGVYCNRMLGIVFSGMGDDGSSAAHQVVDQGGVIWVQDPQTAECAAQPEAMIRTGFVSKVTTVSELAQSLINRSIEHQDSLSRYQSAHRLNSQESSP